MKQYLQTIRVFSEVDVTLSPLPKNIFKNKVCYPHPPTHWNSYKFAACVGGLYYVFQEITMVVIIVPCRQSYHLLPCNELAILS